jgi:hypothetical protein
MESGILDGGYFFTGAFLTCAGQDGPIARQVRRFARDWIDALEKALVEARRHSELAKAIEVEQTAFEMNSILLGAQWSQLMAHTDYTNARSAILAKLQSLATDEIPPLAFKSVNAWKGYLKHRGR